MLPVLALQWPHSTSQTELAHAIGNRIAERAVDCIQMNSINSTRIIDRTAIIFDTGGRTLYVNTPPVGAAQLDSGAT